MWPFITFAIITLELALKKSFNPSYLGLGWIILQFFFKNKCTEISLTFHHYEMYPVPLSISINPILQDIHMKDSSNN